MSMKIISGSEWYPLQVQEGLSLRRKKEAFIREIQEFNGKIFFTEIKLPVEKSIKLFYFDKFFVNVNETVLEKFLFKFSPYLEGNQLKYDNLINLCIMVKNAGEGFREVLTKNLPYIDRYTILDTGSTDNTLSIIKEVLHNKRGEIYQEPFINFRDSRNRLLDLAGNHCHFNIMIDDTYVLDGNIREFLDFARGDDVVDSYSITIEDSDTMYMSNRITKSSKNLRYINIIHEIIQSENNFNVGIPYKFGSIKDITSDYMIERTKERKQKDIDSLMEMLKQNPNDPRTYYYIADSYICLKDWENALIWFLKRIQFSGYDGEYQDSLYYIAVLKNFYLKHSWEECGEWYLKCYESNPTRAESLYFIGEHYRSLGMKNTAFLYWKRAYDLGMPDIQMSVRKNIYNFHIPKDLSSICYELGEFKLGEEAARKALIWQDDSLTRKWLQIFYHINRYNDNKTETQKSRLSNKKTIAFVSPGGWDKWDGKVLREKGLGGSENFTIRYGEQLANFGYAIYVFCDCSEQIIYNNVTYIPLEKYVHILSLNVFDYVIINRYPEYIPVTCIGGVKTYYVMHDLALSDDIIILHPNLLGTLCISDWHKNHFIESYGACKSITKTISYGVDLSEYTQTKKEKYMFIYPSFPNRGLLQLLNMWSLIVEKYPSAILHIFCDTKHKWCQKHWKNEMDKVDELLEIHKKTVINHGWVNGKILREYWAKSHVWLYPCTFNETSCLTAFEAAVSRTLAVTNDLAALQESVGDRGVVIKGNAFDKSWHDEALDTLFKILDNSIETIFTDRNYEWVKTKNFIDVVGKFNEKFLSQS